MNPTVLTLTEQVPGQFKTLQGYSQALAKTLYFHFMNWAPKDAIFALHEIGKNKGLLQKMTVHNTNEIVLSGSRVGVVTDSAQVVSIPMSVLYEALGGTTSSGASSNPIRPGVGIQGAQVTSKNEETFWVPLIYSDLVFEFFRLTRPPPLLPTPQQNPFG